MTTPHVNPTYPNDFVQAVAAFVQAWTVPGRPTLVAIDGRACAGKSTLATQLATALGPDTPILGVDSFFIPFAQQAPRTPGVLRHLRWQEFVDALASFRRGHRIRYQPYDWDRDVLSAPESIEGSRLVVEGLHALAEGATDERDVRIWVEGRLDTQLDRVVARDGADDIDQWHEEWIPVEQDYIKRQRPYERAHLIVAGAELRISDVGRQLTR